MAENDYFPMAGPSEMGAGGGEDEGPAAPPEQKEEDTGNTALLPKSILGGKDFQPGEEVVLKIVRVHGDEIEVEYASDEKPTEGPSANDEIDAMASPGRMPEAAQEGY